MLNGYTIHNLYWKSGTCLGSYDRYEINAKGRYCLYICMFYHLWIFQEFIWHLVLGFTANADGWIRFCYRFLDFNCVKYLRLLSSRSKLLHSSSYPETGVTTYMTKWCRSAEECDFYSQLWTTLRVAEMDLCFLSKKLTNVKIYL
jgi:hypothetical protein